MIKRAAGVLLAVVLLAAGFLCYQFYQTKRQSEQLDFKAISMENLQDGSYEGECRTGLVYVQLRIQVKDDVVKSIQLLQHDNGMGKSAERLLADIQDKNSTAVDDVSSATISSRAIRMAAQNALEKAAGSN